MKSVLAKTLVKALASGAGFKIYRNGSLPSCADLVADLERLGIDLSESLIVDVGANEGQMATYFREHYPESQIICLEPFRNTFNICRTRFGDDRKVKCLPLALAETVGDRWLFVSSDSQLNSLLPQLNSEGPGSVLVQVDTLDNLCADLEITNIDLLKIDTEGVDLDVLRGGSRTLDSNKIGLVLAECGFDRADKRKTFFSDLHEFLEQYDFAFLGLYNVRHAGNRLYFCDGLFISQKYSFP